MRHTLSSQNLEAYGRRTVPRRVIQSINELNISAEHFDHKLLHPVQEGQPGFELQIASDLHIEMFYREKYKPKSVLLEEIVVPSAPVLALLGDICCPANRDTFEDYQNFLLAQAENFEAVLVIAGNHEFYDNGFGPQVCTVAQVKRRIRKLCDSHPRLHFLDRKSMVFGDVRVIGCTLWTHIPSKAAKTVEAGINDYHRCYVDTRKEGPDPTSSSPDLSQKVRRLSAHDTNRWHQHDLRFIQQECVEAARLGQKAVVLTHHTPTFRGTSNPKFANSPIRWAFSTELEWMMDYQNPINPYQALHTWASGHTHWSCDQVINRVHVVSNQYGYTGTAECTYKPGFVVHVN